VILLERYKGTIASLIATLLRETKEVPGILVPFDTLEPIYTAEADDQVQLDDLLGYINAACGEAIKITSKDGVKGAKITDKISLWLMLFSLNADLADVSLLAWTDFEKLVQYAMSENGYKTRKNYRFTDGNGKRHEVDIVAADRYSKEHLIFLIDAKQWDYRSNSSTTRMLEAANEQYLRCVALGDTVPVLSDLLFDMGLEWHECVIIPMVVTLLNPPVQNFYIPLVSILAFNNFILEFAANMDSFKKKYVKGIPIQTKLK
jgi:hypothetical protein